MVQDIRQAWRMLAKNPGFTAIAVCSLGIGIGANSAIFTIADGLLLRPLPVMEPSRVVAVNPMTSGALGASESMSHPDYADLRDRTRTFQGLVGFGYSSFGYSVDSRAVPSRKLGTYVTGNFFQVLGVEPVLGRGFRSEDDKPGREPVVVLSHGLWVSDFGASASAIGQKLRLNGVDFTVVGVAPERFTGMDQYMRPALFVPAAVWPRMNTTSEQDNIVTRRDVRWLMVKGRLKPGVTLQQAQSDTDAIIAGLRRTYPQADRDLNLKIETELQRRVQESPPDTGLLEMLMVLATCVLLVACANVAGLLLSRSRARTREIAVRLAMGAARWQLIRQLMIENLLLAVLGGALGVLVAYAGVALFGKVPMPTDLPMGPRIELDNRVFAFTFVVSLLSTFVFGLAPAWRSSRTDVISALKARDAEQGGKRRLWGRHVLVGAQVAVSVVLLIVSAVLVEDFQRLLGAGPGYRTEQLFLMSLDPNLLHYTGDQTARLYQQLLDGARATPGVRSAALAYTVPMAMNGSNLSFVPEGYELPKDKTSLDTFDNIVSDEYFEALGVPVVRGRGFLPSDKAHTTAVAVVNEHFAAHYWPQQDAIGKRIHLNNATGPLVEIVGIAKVAKYIWVAEQPMDFVYLPYTQNQRSEMTLIAQTQSPDATEVAPALRALVHRLDANMPVFETRTMQDLYDKRAVQVPRLITKCVGSMGLLGLILAVVGLYGLVAYSVSRRTREIGIRMAVGADRPSVLRLVIRQGFVLGAAGVVVGSVVGIFACRAMTAALTESFGSADPVMFAAVSLLLLVITSLAAYAPARRASLIDPMRALRDE